jgi:hypothetical protein
MPSRLRDGFAGDHQAGSPDEPLLGRTNEADIAAAGIPHGREPPQQRRFEMTTRVEGAQRRVRAVDRGDVEAGTDRMEMSIDETGKEGQRGCIELVDVIPGWMGLYVSRQFGDPIAARDDVEQLPGVQSLAIEIPARPDVESGHERQNFTFSSTP